MSSVSADRYRLGEGETPPFLRFTAGQRTSVSRPEDAHGWRFRHEASPPSPGGSFQLLWSGVCGPVLGVFRTAAAASSLLIRERQQRIALNTQNSFRASPLRSFVSISSSTLALQGPSVGQSTQNCRVGSERAFLPGVERQLLTALLTIHAQIVAFPHRRQRDDVESKGVAMCWDVVTNRICRRARRPRTNSSGPSAPG